MTDETRDRRDGEDGEADEPTTVSRRRALFALGGAGALTLGAVYAARSLAGGDGGSTPAGTFTSADGESAHLGVPYAGTPIMGSLEAPLRLFYWGDYQCPYCKQFEQRTLPKLASNYVEPGNLAIAFLEFPVFGADSRTAAELSKCVWHTVREGTPGAWGRWHRHVLEQQGKKGSGWASKANLYGYTTAVDDVSAQALRRCMREHGERAADLVDRDVSVALEELGLRRATPAFAVSSPLTGKWAPVPGAQPYEVFERAFEAVREE